MTRVLAALFCALPLSAFAADLFLDWDQVTVDETGAPLPGPVDEYRVKDCAGNVIAVVDPSVSEYLEADVVVGTGVYCRQVVAYIVPLESDPLEATLVVVKPGAPTNLSIQAIQ